MGTSWHDFLFGALEPGGSVAIDKPAPALWPQVLATRLLGFHTSALLVPEALAGTAAVGLVYVLARMLWGAGAGLASAAALAVLPIAVLTARSDTMDALATALAVLAAVALVRAANAEGPRGVAPTAASPIPAASPVTATGSSRAAGGAWAVAGAGVAIGAAFNVKLFQALVPVPALAVMYFAASPLPIGERLRRLALFGSVALAVGLSWLVVVSTAPGREQPFAFGSSNGSALSAAFAYDGVDRLDATAHGGHHAAAQLAQRPDPPGATRLVGGGGDLGALLGSELVPALLLGGAAAGVAAMAEGRRRRNATSARRAAAGGDTAPGSARAVRLAWAGAAGVAVWLVTALALFSFLGGLQVRYLDALAPAVALALGGGAALLARWARAPRAVVVVALAAILVVPTIRSVGVVHAAQSDSGHIGALPQPAVDRLSAFLQANTQGQRYELASATAVKATPLIAHDGRRVLMLGTLAGHPITPLATFLEDVRHREVSYVLIAGRCGPQSSTGPAGCGRAARWAVVHGTNLAKELGVPLYEVHPPLSNRRYPRRTDDARPSTLHPHRGRRVHAS
jgi:4-amino-4-deoxy-L-arabinose transferase-like glycosyltransferase